MSGDEVLASNLWPWPDPLLKRNQAGLVLFVNAAFLQLYGGQVQDWCAKPLAGWPAPVNAGAQRFETRIGTAPNESVFDWVESTMADGNALAIARNVTIFMTASVPQNQGTQTQPELQQTAAPALAPAPAQIVEPNTKPAQNVEATSATTDTSQPVTNVKNAAQPLEFAAPDLSTELDDTLNKRADEYAYSDNQSVSEPPQSNVVAPPVADQISQEQTAQTTSQEQVAVPTPQTEPQAEPQTEPQESTRMMERRALPIEDSTNVLGTNWRDDVIAKAVGGTESSEAIISEEMPGEEATPKPADGLQILLAEDNAINALLTRTLLEAEGANVDTVEDGALALDAVSKKKYDLIFMDMRMPNMDGLESTRKIRAFGFDRPIIALTANAFDDDRNACFDSGMNDFMTKPVSAEELSEMVATWTKSEAEKLAS